MRNYLVSFRVLGTGNKSQLIKDISNALQISWKRANALYEAARWNKDIKIKVTAEQLGDLQAMRIMKRYADDIRYLCDVEEIEATKPPTNIIELREGLREVPA